MTRAPSTDRFDARCAETLARALADVKAYRTWREFDPGEGAPIDARYRALPALTKRFMNLHSPAAFVEPGRSMDQALRDGEIELVSTSGTTGDAIQNIWYQPWWDASERASWALNAHARAVASGTHREALLASPLNVGVRSETPLSFDQRRLARFLYLNELVDPLAWPDSHYERMLDELARFQPAILEGNPSLLSRLSRWVTRQGARPFRPALIAMTYEVPSLLHRRHVQAAFDVPLMSSYGSTEAAYVFLECEHGRLHQNVESCRVDFLPFRAELASPGSSGSLSIGKILITTFGNPWRVLVRFDPGDLAQLADGPCPCGRTEGLTLSSIEGRAINLTLRPDGRVVTQAEVDRRLAEIEGLDEYQLLQIDRRSYALGVVSDRGRPRVAAQAQEALAELYGPGAQVTVTRASGFGPEVSGKYRLVKAAFHIDANAFVDPSVRPPLSVEDRAGSERS